MRISACVLLLFFLSSVTFAQQRLATGGWQFVPQSNQNDFTVRCFKGKELVWGVYPRNDTSDWQVARNIYMYTTVDGRSTLSFLRGFVTANKQTTYIPAADVSCEITQQ